MNQPAAPTSMLLPAHEGQTATAGRLSSGVGRRLSVVIPTRNRREALLATLRGLSRQSASPESYEVIVVADGCTDGTASAVHALSNGPHWQGRGTRLVCVEQEWSGASAARNRGLREAQGEIVLLLDDDIEADPRLIEGHLGRHGSGPGSVVLGRIIPTGGKGALKAHVRKSLERHEKRLLSGNLSFMDLRTANVSVPREAALAAGGLAEDIFYGEDSEFGYRLHKLGLPFVYASEAAGTHNDPKSAAALLGDIFKWGQGCVKLYRRTPELLPHLPLSAYGETSLRLRLARGLLLRISEIPPLARLVERLCELWASSNLPERLSTPVYELVRSYYLWRGIRSQVKERAEWARFTDPGVVVLMYHSVPASGSAERFKLPRRQLERQMRLLKIMGRSVRPLQACVSAWDEGKMPPPRTVAITFDDGYRDNLTQAWPVLRQMRYPATLFFITGEAESADEMRNAECRVPAEWVRNAPAPTIQHRQPRQVFAFAVSNSLLSWQEACELDGVGFRVESHGITHSNLASLDPDDARTELVESRLELEARLGRPVTIFAYPYGEFNRDLEKLAAEAGYLAAFGTHEGPNNLHTPRYGMKRVEISGHDNLLAFALKIWAGEDPFRRFARKRM